MALVTNGVLLEHSRRPLGAERDVEFPLSDRCNRGVGEFVFGHSVSNVFHVKKFRGAVPHGIYAESTPLCPKRHDLISMLFHCGRLAFPEAMSPVYSHGINLDV